MTVDVLERQQLASQFKSRGVLVVWEQFSKSPRPSLQILKTPLSYSALAFPLSPAHRDSNTRSVPGRLVPVHYIGVFRPRKANIVWSHHSSHLLPRFKDDFSIPHPATATQYSLRRWNLLSILGYSVLIPIWKPKLEISRPRPVAPWTFPVDSMAFHFTRNRYFRAFRTCTFSKDNNSFRVSINLGNFVLTRSLTPVRAVMLVHPKIMRNLAATAWRLSNTWLGISLPPDLQQGDKPLGFPSCDIAKSGGADH